MGLTIALVLSFSTVVLGLTAPTTSHHQHHQQHDTTDKGSGILTDETRATEEVKKSRHNKTPWSRSSATPYVVAVLLICLYVGSLLQILAQLFGMLGLTVNATPSDTQDAYNDQSNTTFAYFAVGHWTIGKALSTYATVAWTSAVLCAAVATSVFRTPRFTKLL